MRKWWIFRRKHNLSQISSSVGNVYDVLDVDGDIFTVRDTKTRTHFGYIGCATYADVTVNGPMTPQKQMAVFLARQCAYNLYQARVKASAHSKNR